MKCFICKREFIEKDIQESHDVPCYLFEGNRRLRKQEADKYGRHWLCKECHERYENNIRIFLVSQAKKFGEFWFKEAEDDSI